MIGSSSEDCVDVGEMSSVLETFAPAVTRRYRTDYQTLHLGPAKANIGRGGAVSSVSGLTIILLMMQKMLSGQRIHHSSCQGQSRGSHCPW